MYLNTVFKYKVFKYCPSLLVVSKSLLFVAISELSSKKKSKRYTVLGLKWIYGKSVSKR